MKDAIAYALKRVYSLERMPDTETSKTKILHLRIILGHFMIEMNYFKKAEEVISPITELALGGGDRKIRSQILTVMGSCEYVIRENFPKALEYLEEALQISTEMKDMGTLAAVSYWIGCAYWLNCQFEKAEINVRRAMDINRAAKISWRESTLKSLLSYMAYYSHGKIQKAFELSQDALNIAEESGDIFSKTFAYSCHGISSFGKGSFEKAILLLEKGREFSEKLDQYWWKSWSNHFLGETYFELGQYQEARDHFKVPATFLEYHGIWPSSNIASKIGFTRAKVFNNEDVNVENLYEYFSLGKARQFEGQIRRYMAEILMKMDGGRISEAESWIEEAIDADDRNEMLFELGRDYSVKAEIQSRKGERPGAVESLKEATEIFKECGADGWVTKYEKELATLS